MRITNSYMTNNMIRNVQNNLSSLARVDEQMATSRRVLRPSDDPNIMSQLLAVKSTLSYNEKYAQNIQDGLSYLDMADTAMGTMADVLSQAKDYTIQGSNATYNSDDQKVLAKQIDNIIDQMVDLANVTVTGKYVFAGKENDQAPFVRTVIENSSGEKEEVIIYRGDFNKITREVLSGTSYAINVPAVLPGKDSGKVATGDEWDYDRTTAFGNVKMAAGEYVKVKLDGNSYKYVEPTDPDYDSGYYVVDTDDKESVFKVLFELKAALNCEEPYDSKDAQADKLNEILGTLENVRDGVLQARVEVGARYNHFEMLKDHLLDQEVSLTGDLKNMEGADMSKLSIELNQKWLAYSASMATGSKLMQTSLLDYIR